MGKITSTVFTFSGKFKFILIILSFLNFQALLAQKVLQEGGSLTAPLIPDEQGPASGSADLHYRVWGGEDYVLFSVSFSQIRFNTGAGFIYKNRKYGREVPGLIELLEKTGADYPKVHFDIYYGSAKQGSFTYSISARNDLSLLTGDFYKFQTSPAMAKGANWRLVATGFSDFNYKPVTQWMNFQDLIFKYEREKKDREEYEELVQKADALFRSNQLEEAMKAYYSAAAHHLADSHPKAQAEKIKQQLAQEENRDRFEGIMQLAEKAAQQGDYAQALSYYNSASSMGVDNSSAERQARYMDQKIEEVKRQQEQELKEKQRLEAQKQEELLAEQERQKEEAEIAFREREEEIQRQKEEEEERILEDLERKERRKLEKEREEMLEAQQRERERQQQEEEERIQREEEDRRVHDDSRIGEMENQMAYNPLLYLKNLREAEKFFEKALSVNPYEALEIKQEWWDSNPYMEEFRDDLNEPRRQEAWEEHQNLLYQQEGDLDAAKYFFIEAIQYTDYNSAQHEYLLKKVDMINEMIDLQKSEIRMSRDFEVARQQDVETARAYKIVNRMRDNHDRAAISYHVLTQDYLYPNLNSTVENSANAIQRQYDFENRLNQADQQLSMDNAVTGYTTNIAMSAMFDESKSTELYANNTMGLNFFTFTGFASIPVVANDVPSEGKIPETFAETVMVMPFVAGFDWWINRGKFWDVAITGDGMVGVLPMLGYSNSLFSFGGNFKLNLGIKAVKLTVEADYHTRSASYKYDQDVAASATADEYGYYLPPTERILTGDFNYSTIKVGGGLHINISDEWNDGYLRMLVYAEKPSFYQNYDMKKPVLSTGVQAVFPGGITVSALYSKNYPVAGKAEHLMYTYTDRDLVMVNVGKTWTIGTTRKKS